MGIERLKDTLLKEAEQEAEVLTAEAHLQAKKLLEKEMERAATAKKQIQEEIEKALEAYKQERLAWAQLEAQRIIAEAKEDAIKAAIESTYDELKNNRDKAAYKAYLNAAVQQAKKELGLPLIVHIGKDDRTALKTMDRIEVMDDWENELGGIWIETPDGKLRFNATMQARMESYHEELRKNIYEKLFSSGGKTDGKKSKKRD